MVSQVLKEEISREISPNTPGDKAKRTPDITIKEFSMGKTGSVFVGAGKGVKGQIRLVPKAEGERKRVK